MSSHIIARIPVHPAIKEADASTDKLSSVSMSMFTMSMWSRTDVKCCSAMWKATEAKSCTTLWSTTDVQNWLKQVCN